MNGDQGKENQVIAGLRTLHTELALAGPMQGELEKPDGAVIPPLLAILRGDAGRSAGIPGEVWERLPGLLAPHGMLPLLYRRILDLGIQVPETAVDLFRSAFLQSRANTLRQDAQLQAMLAAFAENGVESLVLKGPALGRSVYPDPVLRPSGDIDLLVRPADVLRAGKALLALGFVLPLDNYRVSPSFYDQETYLPAGGSPFTLPVELHWEVQRYGTRYRQAPLQELFERAVSVSTPGLTFRTLSPVHALMYSGSHMALHHADEVRLIWVQDAALLASRLDEAGWRDLRRECQRWEATIPVERLLTMASLWFGSPAETLLTDWPQPSATETATYDGVLHGLHRVRIFLSLRWPQDAPLPEKVRLLGRLFLNPLGEVRGDQTLRARLRSASAHLRRWVGFAGRL